MSTHNICFRGEIRKNILCGYLLFYVAMNIYTNIRFAIDSSQVCT